MCRTLVIVMAFILSGCALVEPTPQVKVYQYSYQAVPPTEQAGIPVKPPGPPQPVSYETMFPQRPFDDPTLVIFVNGSDRATLRLTVNEQKERREIVLRPGEVTANIHLDVGDHQVRVRGEVPTAFGPRATREQVITIRVDPGRGRAQIIYLREF